MLLISLTFRTKWKFFKVLWSLISLAEILYTVPLSPAYWACPTWSPGPCPAGWRRGSDQSAASPAGSPCPASKKSAPSIYAELKGEFTEYIFLLYTAAPNVHSKDLNLEPPIQNVYTIQSPNPRTDTCLVNCLLQGCPLMHVPNIPYGYISGFGTPRFLL